MSTILFNHIIFGPIKSRRLGNSLGVNLLPKFGKWCSFDCIYCECGWNKDGKKDTVLPTKEEVRMALEIKLIEFKEAGTPIDTITFSGNGEPTLHPDFSEIIDFTLELRDRIFPQAKVSVLTNATQLGKEEVRNALMKINNPILKIDSPIEEMVNLIDRPNAAYSLEKTIENIKMFGSNFILQTMFLRSSEFDTASPEALTSWHDIVRTLKPRQVMVYTIDRETPDKTLGKYTVEEMTAMVQPLIDEEFDIQVRG